MSRHAFLKAANTILCLLMIPTIWVACVFAGFAFAMTHFDHGDVDSALMAIPLMALGFIAGPFLAYYAATRLHAVIAKRLEPTGHKD